MLRPSVPKSLDEFMDGCRTIEAADDDEPNREALYGWEEFGLEAALRALGHSPVELSLAEASAFVARLSAAFGTSAVPVERDEGGHLEEGMVAAYRPHEDRIIVGADRAPDYVITHEFAHHLLSEAFCFEGHGGFSTPLQMHGAVFARAHVEIMATAFEIDAQALARAYRGTRVRVADVGLRTLVTRWMGTDFGRDGDSERALVEEAAALDREEP